MAIIPVLDLFSSMGAGIAASSEVTDALKALKANIKAGLEELRKEGTVFLTIFRPKNVAEKDELFYTVSMNYSGKKDVPPLLPAEEIIVGSKIRGDIVNRLKEKIPKTDNELKSIGRCIYYYFIPKNIRQAILNTDPKIIIITTNDGDIPWELAYDGEDFWSMKYQVGRFLGESANLFISTRRKEPMPNEPIIKEALIIARPTSDLKKAVDISSPLKSSLDRVIGKEATVVLKGEKASKLQVFDLLSSGDFQIIYYYGHGNFDGKDPLHSSLKLYDGELYSHEIRRLSWNPQVTSSGIAKNKGAEPIVFLNGCETALTKFIDGKNYGIVKSFMEAGAISVIGTFWPIFDKTSAYFTEQFYKNVLQGETIGESLKRAKRKTRTKYSSPQHWAPYILFGSPSKSIFPKPKNQNLVEKKEELKKDNEKLEKKDEIKKEVK
jgi:hypothetical protein